MSLFDQLAEMQRQINSLRAQLNNIARVDRPSGITDHGALGGLSDDDHPRYALKTYVDDRPKFVHLTTPLTSTDFDGDSFSTTAKTKIDLSVKFGVPAGVRAVDITASIRDSGSVGTYCYVYLAPNNTGSSGKLFKADRSINDQWSPGSAIVPCDANGDIYYQINASGTDTFDMVLRIWGYWI